MWILGLLAESWERFIVRRLGYTTQVYIRIIITVLIRAIRAIRVINSTLEQFHRLDVLSLPESVQLGPSAVRPFFDGFPSPVYTHV